MDSIYTIGVDIGSSYIKGVLLQYTVDNPNSSKIISKKIEKIRKRNPADVANIVCNSLLEESNLSQKDIKYTAATGEGDQMQNKTGHFYSMTTHARGGIFLCPDAKMIVDMGALYVRVMKVDSRGKVLDYQMTNQCASGSGQFIENIARYLGLAIEEVGDLSLKSEQPEEPSGICAVLAETDVINFVSRGVSIPNIIMGIHLSIANRIVRLITKLKPEYPVALVGGMAENKGMVHAVKTLLKTSNPEKDIIAPPDAIYSGAIGAAIWGGYRYFKLKEKEIMI
ncbi:MAG TPA: BadF/BadG/BcrA/BcrD ATPase family protein [Bacteroidia bacterium]|nr:BadF/BadG/BcrA/BcrD ATPase family protein [Bacteroidia bacterium]